MFKNITDKPFFSDNEKESNLMHGINGYLFANLPGLEMCLNDKISWHLIGLGNEIDIHGVNFYGQTFLLNSNRKDTVNLIPGNQLYCCRWFMLLPFFLKYSQLNE